MQRGGGAKGGWRKAGCRFSCGLGLGLSLGLGIGIGFVFSSSWGHAPPRMRKNKTNANAKAKAKAKAKATRKPTSTCHDQKTAYDKKIVKNKVCLKR